MAKLPKALTSKIDPDVKIPASVLAASAHADALHASLHPTLQIVSEVPGVPVAAAPGVVVTPEVIAPPVVPVAAPATDETWEHKFNSVNGRYSRSVRQMDGMSQQIAGLEATIAAMSAAPRAPVPAELRAVSLLTDQETTEYGEDFLDVVGRKAAEKFSPEVSDLKKQMAELQKRLESVGGVVAQSARTTMQADLTRSVPNWLALNEDDKFLDWLALPDTYSGAIRQTLLETAYDRNDTRRVAAFFNGFLAEEAATSPRPELPVPAAIVPKTPLAGFAAPGRAKTAASTLPAEKPSFTQAQVTRFYADVAARKYAGRDDEKNQIERQIHEAANSGRLF